jgi:hypothetical protein
MTSVSLTGNIHHWKTVLIKPIFYTTKISFMTNLLYVVAVVLIIGWLLGFFFFHAGNLIHILLVVAVVAIIIRVIQGRKAV